MEANRLRCSQCRGNSLQLEVDFSRHRRGREPSRLKPVGCGKALKAPECSRLSGRWVGAWVAVVVCNPLQASSN